MRRGRLPLLVAMLLAAASATGAGGEVRIGGHFKNFFTALDPPSLSGVSQPLEGEGYSRLRLELFGRRGSSVAAEIAYELAPRLRQASPAALAVAASRPPPASYRAVDFSTRIYPGGSGGKGSFALLHNLDRAFVTFSTSFADFHLGRQPVAFGSARVVNPIDLLEPFAYEALDKEDRVGVDALRARVPVGDLSELDAGLVFGEDFGPGDSALFLRGHFFLGQADVAPAAVLFRENLLLGVDLARSLGGAGSWLEAGYTLAGFLSDYQSGENYLRLSTGLDYSFGSRLYCFVEYHLNGAGSALPEAYLEQAGETAYREGGVHLWGRHYAAPGMTVQVTPLLGAGLQALINVRDGSALVAPRLAYSFADNVAVAAGGFFSLGRRARISPGPGLVPRSEFGLYPGVYFTSVALYF